MKFRARRLRGVVPSPTSTSFRKHLLPPAGRRDQAKIWWCHGCVRMGKDSQADIRVCSMINFVLYARRKVMDMSRITARRNFSGFTEIIVFIMFPAKERRLGLVLRRWAQQQFLRYRSPDHLWIPTIEEDKQKTGDDPEMREKACQ